jgi:hypothetical protein
MIFRGKLCAALNKAGLLAQVPPQVWQKDWVVNCKAAGQGRQVLNYLARYVFRVAISNSRLERIENGEVTFRYRDNRHQQLRRETVSGVEFMRRFLQHTLPRGCAKVRYYGICSPASRQQLEQARTLLGAAANPARDAVPNSPLTEQATPAPSSARCPHCHLGQLFEVRVLPPQRKVPP